MRSWSESIWILLLWLKKTSQNTFPESRRGSIKQLDRNGAAGVGIGSTGRIDLHRGVDSLLISGKWFNYGCRALIKPSIKLQPIFRRRVEAKKERLKQKSPSPYMLFTSGSTAGRLNHNQISCVLHLQHFRSCIGSPLAIWTLCLCAPVCLIVSLYQPHTHSHLYLAFSWHCYRAVSGQVGVYYSLSNHLTSQIGHWWQHILDCEDQAWIKGYDESWEL